MEAISRILETEEVYSSSRIAYILNCRRKGFFHYLFEGGLDGGVGPGAHIGTCYHKALNVYYAAYETHTLEDRRLLAIRAFDKEWHKHFDGVNTETKHGLERNIYTLDRYIDKYILEDQLFRPVASEIYFILPVFPQEGEVFKPFYWQGRADIVFERIANGDRFVVETKCPGSGVERQIVRMRINRQMVGNVWALRQYPGERPITGAMSNVILVAAQKVEFDREYHHYGQRTTESWRRQTIQIVEEWRGLATKSEGMTDEEKLDVYYQNDEECTSYGMCPFHKMCYQGLAQRETMDFKPTRKNPFMEETNEEKA